MKLNIPQLTLAKLARSGRHQNRAQEVPGSIFTGKNILLLDFFLSHREASDSNIANFCVYENLEHPAKICNCAVSFEIKMIIFCKVALFQICSQVLGSVKF